MKTHLTLLEVAIATNQLPIIPAFVPRFAILEYVPDTFMSFSSFGGFLDQSFGAFFVLESKK